MVPLGAMRIRHCFPLPPAGAAHPGPGRLQWVAVRPYFLHRRYVPLLTEPMRSRCVANPEGLGSPLAICSATIFVLGGLVCSEGPAAFGKRPRALRRVLWNA